MSARMTNTLPKFAVCGCATVPHRTEHGHRRCMLSQNVPILAGSTKSVSGLTSGRDTNKPRSAPNGTQDASREVKQRSDSKRSREAVTYAIKKVPGNCPGPSVVVVLRSPRGDQPSPAGWKSSLGYEFFFRRVRTTAIPIRPVPRSTKDAGSGVTVVVRPGW